jgi:hypothetical protein
MMLFYSLNYTVTIVNVLNPPSLIPFTYKTESTFLGSINTASSLTLSMSQAKTLNMAYISSTNLTYGQNTQLSLTLKNDFYEPFDEIKVYLPKLHVNKLLGYNDVNLSLLNTTYGYS